MIKFVLPKYFSCFFIDFILCNVERICYETENQGKNSDEFLPIIIKAYWVFQHTQKPSEIWWYSGPWRVFLIKWNESFESEQNSISTRKYSLIPKTESFYVLLLFFSICSWVYLFYVDRRSSCTENSIPQRIASYSPQFMGRINRTIASGNQHIAHIILSHMPK